MKTLNLAASAFCALLLHGTMAGSANAVPVQFAGNGNYYEYHAFADPADIFNNTWEDAKAAAAGEMFKGATGHLATITTAPEDAFIFGLVSNNPIGFAGAWLGGKAPEGWLVGPEAGTGFGYENWRINEPNNAGYAYMSLGTGTTPGSWLDDSTAFSPQGVPHPLADPVIGYFVEFEASDIATIPVPAAFPLLAGGLGLMGLIGWRRKRKAGQAA